TLQPQSADAVLLVGDIPHRHEPHSQRLSGVLKDCPGRQRRLPLAPSAVQQPPRRHPRLARPPAMRAYEPTRPAQAPDIFAAGGVAAEPLVNLLKRPGIINPGDKISGVLHPPRLSPGPTGVKRIPHSYDTQDCNEIWGSGKDRSRAVARPLVGQYSLGNRNVVALRSASVIIQSVLLPKPLQGLLSSIG